MSAMSIAVIAASIALSSASQDVQGSWTCGPYELTGEEFTALATDRTHYEPSGDYLSEGEATYTFYETEKVTVRMRHKGTWSVENGVIHVIYDSAQFLSSDSPIFTVAMGQAGLDAQMKKRNWVKKRILRHTPNLVTIPVDPLHTAARIEVSCAKA